MAGYERKEEEQFYVMFSDKKLNRKYPGILALIMVFAVTISVIFVPIDVNAASKKKAKKPKVTCSITFKNINGATVIKKGKSRKIQYTFS